MGYLHSAAKTLCPELSTIEPIAGSPLSSLIKVGNNEFMIKKASVTTRLSIIRKMGGMLGNVDSLVAGAAQGMAYRAKAEELAAQGNSKAAQEAEQSAVSAFTFAGPKIIAAICNPDFEALLVECALLCWWKTPKEFVRLKEDFNLDEATEGDPGNLIALGLCYLEVNAQDFLMRVASTLQSRMKQIDVSINTSSKETKTSEPTQSESNTAPV